MRSLSFADQVQALSSAVHRQAEERAAAVRQREDNALLRRAVALSTGAASPLRGKILAGLADGGWHSMTDMGIRSTGNLSLTLAALIADKRIERSGENRSYRYRLI